MSGGFGGGGFGGAFGGSLSALLGGAIEFELFCFTGSGMFNILSAPDVSTVGSGLQFNPNAITNDLEICSGGTFPDEGGRVLVTTNVPQAFTAEWVVTLDSLPSDFSNVTARHVYLGAYDASGPVVGLFVSSIGWAYTGSVSFPGGDLQLDTTFQQLPGSSSYVFEGEQVVVRVAADLSLGVVYLYVTRVSELAISGQQLRAILPVIPASAAAVTPTDQSLVSVRGTATQPVCVFLDQWCLGSSLIIPNLAPVANAGADQAVRLCSIIQLDGSASFDPEGSPVLYVWRLIEAPNTSEFTVERSDGGTFPLLVPTGFTDKFHSTQLGIVDAADPLEVGAQGDVLLVQGEPYTITGKGVDGNGFYVMLGSELLADNISALTFKVLRQRGVSGSATVSPSFFPDVPGFYTFDLTVFDGSLLSAPVPVVVNVLESLLPRGCVPDLSFIFDYLSDFWSLVEDRDRLPVFWSALAQATSTTLFTLWQHEYNKSLRDVQRTFTRRHLHYDLLLGEPLPELTRIRPVFGGVTSDDIPVGGAAGVAGTVLEVISSALPSPVALTLVSLNPVSAQTLAAELQARLRTHADSRFTATVVEKSTGDFVVTLGAPFPFSIGPGSTVPLFTVGDASSAPSGSGAGVGTRTYKLDRSLAGVDVQEDDFLVLNGEAYRISRVLTGAADLFPRQRVVLKETLPAAPATSWVISGWVSSELLDFYDGLVTAGDYLDFEVTETTADRAPTVATNQLVEARVLGANPNQEGRVAVDFKDFGEYVANPGFKILLARVLRKTFLPVAPEVLDVPTLQEKIVVENDQETLRRNVDFFLEEVRGQRALRFVAGNSVDPGDVWEGVRPPHRLWAEYTILDNSQTIENNFGIPAGLTLDQLAELPENIDYLSAVRGLWFAYVNGPTIRNLRIGVQILLGLPFAEEAGVIEEIRTDFSTSEGRILIRDEDNPELVRSYRFPRVLALEVNPRTGAVYAEGDAVTQFAPLVEGAEVQDYITDPTWFEGLLNQGIFYEPEKFQRFLVRARKAAFNLSSLLVVRDFILSIKPMYTFPLFLVQQQVQDTGVSTTDDVTTTGLLMLHDAPCQLLGVSWMYDQPRPAGGGWRNQFDSDADPSNAAPAFPVPDATVSWAYDKAYLCPESEVFAVCCVTTGGGTITLDSCLRFDTPISSHLQYADTSPSPIPTGPGGFTLTAVGSSAAPDNGTLTALRFVTQGTPGADPTDYEVVVVVNAVDQIAVPFTAGVNTEVFQPINVAVLSADTIQVRVRPASGGVSRSPAWASIRADVTFEEPAVWSLGDTIPAGAYCSGGMV